MGSINQRGREQTDASTLEMSRIACAHQDNDISSGSKTDQMFPWRSDLAGTCCCIIVIELKFCFCLRAKHWL